jgi:large subunit ribosomal protein L25
VSQLGIGDSIHIGDLTLPEGVTVLHDPDETIITILSPVMEEVKPAATEAVTPAEGVEGEAKPEAKEEGGEG